MAKGFNAVVMKLDAMAGKDIGSLLKTTGMTLVSTVGGSALRDGRYLFAVILFAVTAAVSIAGAVLFDKFLQHRRKKKEKKM